MVQSYYLSVGQVSGVIAAALFAVQAFFVLTIPLILLGTFHNDSDKVTSNAVTWSVLNKALHSSWWPTILRSDSAGNPSVRTPITVAVNFGLAMSIFVSLTAIVTPLGLYDAVVPTSAAALEPFAYTPDLSVIGYGTPPRSNLGFSRICGADLYMLCPGANFTVIYTHNHTEVYVPDGYNTSVPRSVMEVYNSGLRTMNKSVSSIADIQWRTYSIAQEIPTDGGFFNNGSSYLVGDYRQLTSLVLDGTVTLVEGLLVNTLTGGVGFRNQSVPPNSQYGSTWTEDILFVEPQTECVDTNLTLDFPVPSTPGQGPTVSLEIVLTDRGGFVDLDPNYEWFHVNNTQDDDDLRGRAYKAAWLNNALSMIYLNITNPKLHVGRLKYKNSKVGKKYPISLNSGQNFSGTGFTTSFGAIDISSLYGKFWSIPPSADYVNSSTYYSPLYPNPNSITLDNFTLPRSRREDIANISNFGVACGLMYGSPRPKGGDQNPFRSPKSGEMYTQPIYSCASAAKASIKEVTFKYNGSSGLSGLTVVGIADKEYAKHEDKPLWGVENSGTMYRDVLPLWGLVGSEIEGRPNISTLRKESLYLPGYLDSVSAPYDPTQNLPGVSFHMNALNAVFSLSFVGVNVMDYTGLTNFALYRKWTELSKNAYDASKIIDLVWTDMVANAVVGTRGWASDISDASVTDQKTNTAPNTAPIVLYERRVQYKILYGIPAFILLGLIVAVCILTLFLLITKRTSPAKMKSFLNRSSLGRNLTSLLYPDVCSQDAPRKAWMDRNARKMITISSRGAQIAGTAVEGEEGGMLVGPEYSAPAGPDKLNRPSEKKTPDAVSAGED